MQLAQGGTAQRTHGLVLSSLVLLMIWDPYQVAMYVTHLSLLGDLEPA